MLIDYTLWPGGMYDIDTPRAVRESWSDLVARFSTHKRLHRKQDAPGFGPYRIRPPRTTCYRHRDGQPRSEAHRCDDCVDVLTLCGFDVDIGTQEQVDECLRRLDAAGLAYLLYSSYSHGSSPGGVLRVAYRLVLPLSEPVAPQVWPGFRAAVLRRYQIPADPQQCQGRSHYYHMPSCPDWATPVVRSAQGAPLAVRQFAAEPMPKHSRHHVRVTDDWALPPEPDEPADLAPLLKRLTALHQRLLRDGAGADKARWLGNMLAGVNIDQHGQRNRAFLCVTGILAYLTSGESLGTYQRIIQPCLDASIAAGSAHTWDDDIERMLVSAMRNKYLADKIDADSSQRMRASVEDTAQRARAKAAARYAQTGSPNR